MTGPRPVPVLVTPPNDGEVLIEPHRAAMAEAVAHNGRHLQRSLAAWGGERLVAYRQAVRAALGHSPDTPIVAVGHQPEFYHPGVWAKRVVAADVARRSGAAAVHLIVDYDRIRQRELLIPEVRGRDVVQQRVRLPGFERASAYEWLPPWTPADAAVLHGRGSAVTSLLAVEFKHAAGSRWVDQYAVAMPALDAHLGVGVPMVPVTALDLWPFFGLLIADAARLAACYNDALAAHRRAHGVKGTLRPVPDLRVEGSRVELPLWSMNPATGARRRVHVDRGGLYAGPARLGDLPSGGAVDWSAVGRALEAAGWVLRPRALTLTLWARLFVADLFIHGIGGALYDQVTDRILRACFDVEPPTFGVVSATLRPRLPVYGVADSERCELLRRLRDLKYNPQRHAGPDLADLVTRRSHLVDEAVRLRRSGSLDRARRREVFDAIRAVSAELGGHLETAVTAAGRRLAELDGQLASDAAASWREYFYGLFDEERLRALKARLESA